MSNETTGSPLTFGELARLDSLITVMQEKGLRLDDSVKAQSDICCCGAITAEARGKFVINEHDREIVRQMMELESQLEASATLGRLIEIRGELLREHAQREG
jgi:hypothetical protein